MSYPILEACADLIRDLGFLLYGGPVVAFAALIHAVPRVQGLSGTDVVRSYRAWGPGLGLSMGATVFGALSGHWLRAGAWSWLPGSAAEAVGMFAWLSLLALWASNIVLEVWTLEPLRKHDRPGEGISDSVAWNDARVKLAGHLRLQAGLVLLTFSFGHFL